MRWFFRRVYRASWNFDFYRRPLREPWKYAAWYGLGLWLLLGVTIGLVGAYETWTLTERIGRDLQRQIPTIHFRNGNLKVEAPVPYRMTVLDEHQIILDPRASLNRIKLDPSVKLVVVDGSFYLRRGPRDFQSFSTRVEGENRGETTAIHAGTVRELMPTLKPLMALLSVLVYLFVQGIRLVFWVLIVSGAGLLAVGMRYNLSWIDTLKLTCYAVTPVGLLDVFLYTTGLIPMYPELFYGALGLGWLTLAVSRLDLDPDGPDSSVEPSSGT